jgi:Carboxypeptidase regulatory-like domain
MRAMPVAVVILFAAVATAGEVTGIVTNDKLPLPGTTITLTPRAGDVRSTVSNEQGRYRFGGVPNGRYDIKYEMPGLETIERAIVIDDALSLPPQELRVAIPDNLTIYSCSLRTCSDDLPRSRFDYPLCSDEALTTALIESAEGGDRSALALLRQRYRTAGTYLERNRIGRMLLQDREVWNELAAEAELVVRFPHVERGVLAPELEAYCEERNLVPEQLWAASFDALNTISGDPRSRALLYRALETKDWVLVSAAIGGFVVQRDRSALPAIERALARFPAEDAEALAEPLTALR